MRRLSASLPLTISVARLGDEYRHVASKFIEAVRHSDGRDPGDCIADHRRAASRLFSGADASIRLTGELLSIPVHLPRCGHLWRPEFQSVWRSSIVNVPGLQCCPAARLAGGRRGSLDCPCASECSGVGGRQSDQAIGNCSALCHAASTPSGTDVPIQNSCSVDGRWKDDHAGATCCRACDRKVRRGFPEAVDRRCAGGDLQ